MQREGVKVEENEEEQQIDGKPQKVCGGEKREKKVGRGETSMPVDGYCSCSHHPTPVTDVG